MKKKDIMLNKGQYGFYLTYDGSNIQIKTDEKDGESITLEKAIIYIEDKKSNSLWQGSDDKFSYLVLEGQYGKYINVKAKLKTTKGGGNYKFPVSQKVEDLTLDKIRQIIKDSYTAKKNDVVEKPKKVLNKKSSKNIK